jgi:hypothetical protein
LFVCVTKLLILIFRGFPHFTKEGSLANITNTHLNGNHPEEGQGGGGCSQNHPIFLFNMFTNDLRLGLLRSGFPIRRRGGNRRGETSLSSSNKRRGPRSRGLPLCGRPCDEAWDWGAASGAAPGRPAGQLLGLRPDSQRCLPSS